MVHEVTIRGGPLDDLGARERLAAAVHAEVRRRNRGAQPAADALLTRHAELHALAWKDTAGLLQIGVEMLERLRGRPVAFANVLHVVGEAEPIATDLRSDEQHRRAAPLREWEL